MPTEKRQQGMIQNQEAATNLENRNGTDSIENISCYPSNPLNQLLLPTRSAFSSGIINTFIFLLLDYKSANFTNILFFALFITTSL